MNCDLYGKYEDYELRGESFFTAYASFGKDDWRKVIVKRVTVGRNQWYRLCAMWVDPMDKVKGYEKGSWRNPTPDNCGDSETYFKEGQLKELKQRSSSDEVREEIRKRRTDGGLRYD